MIFFKKFIYIKGIAIVFLVNVLFQNPVFGQLSESESPRLGFMVTYTLDETCNMIEWDVTGLPHSIVGQTEYSISVVWTATGTGTVSATVNCGLPSFYSINSDVRLYEPSNLRQVYGMCNLIVVNWEPVSGAAGYYLDVATDVDFTNFVPGYQSLNIGSVNTYNVNSNLISGTTYYARVRAYDSNGSGANSNTASCSTSIFNGDITATPGSGATESQITANWLTASGAQKYYLSVSDNSSFSSYLPGYDNRDVGNVTSATISGLASGTSYYYCVRYYNGSCISSNSSPVSYLTVPSAPVVSQLASDIRYTQMTIEWEPAFGAEKYYLDVSTNSSFSSFITGYNNLDVGNVLAYTITGLNPGTNYYVRVKSYNSSGTSGNSIVVSNMTSDLNNIIARDILVEGITNEDDLTLFSEDTIMQSTVYYDGLGRPMQEVTWRNSPTKTDVIRPISYDIFGRQTKEYLPYTDGNNGTFKENALVDPSTTATNSIDRYHSGQQFQFYQNQVDVAHDMEPYAQTIFESSPLNRPLKQGAPGEIWQPDENISSDDHSVKMEYATNPYGELLWEVTPDNKCVLTAQKYYFSKQLYVTITKDENWNSTQNYINDGTTEEYKDKLGRVLLKRTYNKNQPHDTHYVYDDFGDLRFVIPPEAIHQMKNDQLPEPGGLNILNEDTTFPGSLATDESYYYMPSVTVTLGPGAYTDGFGVEPYQDIHFDGDMLFAYRYDKRHRMIVKKVPGADSVYMVYDNRDRLVLTQDGNQREDNQWLFTKYDHLNRPVITGIYASSLSREAMQTLVNQQAGNTLAWYETCTTGTGNIHGYNNASFPNTDISNYLTVSYYDNYDFLTLSEFDSNFDFGSTNGIYTETNTTKVKGLTTGSKVANLGDNSWLQTVTYYDKKYRPLRIVANNNVGGYDKVYNNYDFIGKVLQTQSVHSKSGDSDLTIDERYEYDHAQRLLYTEQRLNNGNWVRIIDNEYNELGELITKNLNSEDNGTSYAQSVDYSYNIRGWLTNINDPSNLSGDYFGMKLRYNDPQATGQLGSEEQFNGNISEITWQNIQNVNQSTYGFVYDGLNRLSTAEYGETALYLEDNNFNESLTYDYNGNILSLQRTGAGAVIDNLTYDYMGNQLASVQDASTYNADLAHFKDGHTGTSPDYSYDANGNMKVDLNKGIADIQYNHLNLPEFIDFGNGNSITYYYDAAGIKLKKIVSENGTIKVTDYVGGLVYEDGQRQFLQTAEGRIMLNNETMNGPEYQYHLKDHLGNTRVTFTTAPEEDRTSTYLATMEPEVAALEEETFNIPDFRYTDALDNHTPGGITSIRTNGSGSEGSVTGPSMGLHVMPGDKLNIRAFFKYSDQVENGTTVAGIAEMIAGNVATGATGELAEVANIVVSDPGLISNLAFSSDNSIPKAYLHYLFFNKDYIYQNGGMLQVGDTLNAFQELLLRYTVEEEGYVLVYTANQTAEDLDVFIDDLLVEHIESPVIRTDDYYPFGLAFYSSQRTGVLTNKYLYNGKELQTDLDLDWYDYGARMYDAVIGRWSVVDPLAEKYIFASTYNYTLNNPVLFIDPDGNEIVNPNSKSAQYVKSQLIKTSSGKQIWNNMVSSKNSINIHVTHFFKEKADGFKGESGKYSSLALELGTGGGFVARDNVLEKGTSATVLDQIEGGEFNSETGEYEFKEGVEVQMVIDLDIIEALGESEMGVIAEESAHASQEYIDLGVHFKKKDSNGNYIELSKEELLEKQKKVNRSESMQESNYTSQRNEIDAKKKANEVLEELK